MPPPIDKLGLVLVKNRKTLAARSRGRNVWFTPGGKREGNKTCSSYPRSKLTGYSANKSSENPSVPQRRFAPALRHGETPVSPTPFHAFAAPRSRAAGYP